MESHINKTQPNEIERVCTSVRDISAIKHFLRTIASAVRTYAAVFDPDITQSMHNLTGVFDVQCTQRGSI